MYTRLQHNALYGLFCSNIKILDYIQFHQIPGTSFTFGAFMQLGLSSPLTSWIVSSRIDNKQNQNGLISRVVNLRLAHTGVLVDEYDLDSGRN